ncbi:MAG: helix-turn-helix domain-containing protein [Actinobacteria bacterium]|nr:helix-turn-helix domain-containing protein [Actinomycetota bacterium]
MAKLLTVQEVAKELDVTDGRVRQLLLAGRLKGRKAGRDWRIHPKDLGAVRHRPPGRPTNYIVLYEKRRWEIPAYSDKEVRDKVLATFDKNPPAPSELKVTRRRRKKD